MALSIKIDNINKTFYKPTVFFWKKNNKIQALKNVSFRCPEKKISCILGPNGAGKTTIIKILSGLIIQDSGEINFINAKLQKNKKNNIGLMTSNERSFYWRLTGRQNLNFFAELYGLKGKIKKERINQLLKDFSVEKDADLPLRLYSTGMKYKLLIIRALISDPDVIILDEPTSHIDPLARENIHKIIKENIINKNLKTVILCTHDLEEAQFLSDHLILLNEGKVIAEGSYDDLKKKINPNIIFKIFFVKKPKRAFFNSLSNYDLFEQDNEVQICMDNESDVPEIIKNAVENNGKILWCKEEKESLFEIFKRLTSGEK
ncbi:MAG: ABC transporter ATP-binding protein [Spirochaetes bacterium]|nr:ABC transporter ATP-binding protein [Spirochaetota bacterium]